MKRVASVLVMLLGMILLPAIPANAHSTWKPTLVPLTIQMQHEAYTSQHVDCYYYESRMTRRDSVYQTYYRARCNPFDQKAKAFSKRSPQHAEAYRTGLRTGWCMRWLGLSPLGTKVSTTCAATVSKIYYQP